MNNAANTNNEIRFFFNGLKVGKGALQKGSWSFGKLINGTWTLTLYGKGDRFTSEVRDALDVRNDSDAMTDYFENDRIRFCVAHPMFLAAAKAAEKKLEKDIARCEAKGHHLAKQYAQELTRLRQAMNGEAVQ